ncbi:MAG: DUF3060 domain-containing protein [Chloracidobacterium sp.]|nr:DUF3060 domain-containing protein [Chloracidobacterium sp.]
MKIKPFIILSFVSMIAMLTSCDLRSGIAKEEMEKWEAKPTSTIQPSPSTTPPDPVDIVEVDTSVEGDPISANGYKQTTKTVCTKYNRLMINGSDGTITVAGVCRQIVINGDRNKITANAAMQLVLNGSDNIVKYLRYPNGKKPSVVENRPDNIIEKIPVDSVIISQPETETLNEHNKWQRPLPNTEKRPRQRPEKLLHRPDDRLLS